MFNIGSQYLQLMQANLIGLWFIKLKMEVNESDVVRDPNSY